MEVGGRGVCVGGRGVNVDVGGSEVELGSGLTGIGPDVDWQATSRQDRITMNNNIELICMRVPPKDRVF